MVSKDRLKELKGDEDPLDKLEKEGMDLPDGSPFLAEFFMKVSEIRQNLNLAGSSIGTLRDKHSAILNATDGGAEAGNQAEAQQLMDQATMAVTKCKSDLKSMQQDNRRRGRTVSQSENKIRMNMHMMLMQKFQQNVAELQSLSAQFKGKLDARAGRQAAAVNVSASPAEIEASINGNMESIFKQATMNSPSYTIAKDIFLDAQEKNENVRTIETSIVELHSMFIDMAALVDQQGDMLNSIEYSVTQSMRYAEQGVGDLEQASEYQKAAAKKLACLGLVVGSIVAVGCVAYFVL